MSITVNDGQPINRWNYMSAYAIAVKHGYRGTEEEWLADVYGGAASARADAEIASEARTVAVSSASNAEAYAVGTRGGEPVEEDDPAYQHNGKFYADTIGGRLDTQDTEIAAIRQQVSAPFVIAEAVADFTDQTKAYVYVGDEDGYVKGGWYYYDSSGSAWTRGGMSVDATLSVEGAAADAKAAGFSLAALRESGESATEACIGVRLLAFKRGYWTTKEVGGTAEFVDSDSYAPNYVSTICACQKGDVFTVHVAAGASYRRTYAILDSEMAVLQRADSSYDPLNISLKIEQDAAAFLVINNLVVSSDPTHGMPTGYYAMKGTPPVIDSVPVEDSTNAVQSGGVYDDLEELRNVIGYDEEELLGEFTQSKYWNSEGEYAVYMDAAVQYRAYDAIEVSPGDRLKIIIYGPHSDKQNPVLFVDDDLAIIARYGTRDVNNTINVIVPSGATKALLTTQRYKDTHCYKLTLSKISSDSTAGAFPYAGKNVAIIGDSFSTNGDWTESNPWGNVPEIIIQEEDVGVELSAYATAYDVGTTVGGHEITEEDHGTEITFTPVEEDVGKIVGKPLTHNKKGRVIWWEVAQSVLGFNPIPVCWSGSSITDHDAGAKNTSPAIHPAQIRKCGIRTPGSMERTAPDMIIIARGANDLTHSPYAHITDYMDSCPLDYPDTDTYVEGGVTKYDYCKGLRLLIHELREAYPEAVIVLCTLLWFLRGNNQYFTTNGTDTWQQYNDAIRRVAAHEGCGVIDFAKAGLNWANAANGYYEDDEIELGHPVHPSSKGHKVLGNRALLDLAAINGKD